MASLVPINQNHLVNNDFGNMFKYAFPGSAVNMKDVEMSVQNISMFNSQFNIDATAYGNNAFQIEVPTAATVQLIDVVLADGNYPYDQINQKIQAALVSAGAYLINANGDNVFYIQIEANSTYYACQIDVSSTPTSLPTNYTRPSTGLYSSGGSGLPITGRTPRFIVTTSPFGSIVGYAVGSYPSGSSTTSQSFLSTVIPQINPVSAYLLRCSLINNSFTTPSDVLTTFNTQGTSAGQLISYTPNQPQWISVPDGSYSTITLTIVDQLERFVKFKDPNLLITLSFRKKKIKQRGFLCQSETASILPLSSRAKRSHVSFSFRRSLHQVRFFSYANTCELAQSFACNYTLWAC